MAGRKITIKQHDELKTIESELKKSNDGRYHLKLMAIRLAYLNRLATLICNELMIDRHTLFRWLKIYNESGKEGIKNIKITGRKEGNPIWPKEIFEALCKEIDKQEGAWTILRMREWIKEHYNLSMPLETIRYRINKADYSFKSGRPYPYKANRDAQVRFKKTAYSAL